MNARTLAIAIALFLLAVFALLNWSAFSTPTALTLGFAEVQAPLGLVMLVVTGIVSGLFLGPTIEMYGRTIGWQAVFLCFTFCGGNARSPCSGHWACHAPGSSPRS